MLKQWLVEEEMNKADVKRAIAFRELERRALAVVVGWVDAVGPQEYEILSIKDEYAALMAADKGWDAVGDEVLS